jgi:cytochrome c oxidase cbb3-type subunit 1
VADHPERAVLGFWTLAVFGCWTGFYRGLPIPAWMVSAGIAAAVIMMGGVISVAANLWLTLGGSGVKKTPLLGFFKTSLIFFVLGSLFAVFAAMIPQLRLTLFWEGTEQIALYGFVGLALFGAIHYIVPRLADCTNDRFIGANCWATLIGLVLFAGAYLVAGMVQQEKLSDGAIPFVEVMNSSKMFIRLSTMGVLLLLVGNVALLLRVVSLVRECVRQCGCCSWRDEAVVSAKPVGATR